MKYKIEPIRDQEGVIIWGSIAVVWRNNAIWLCTECGEFLEYGAEANENQVVCTKAGCMAMYEIDLDNKNNALVAGIRRVRKNENRKEKPPKSKAIKKSRSIN